MKKFICIIVFILSSLPVFLLGNKKTNAMSSLNGYNVFGLGRSINVATDGYLDYDCINAAENIFDSTWFNDNITIDIVDIGSESDTEISSGKNIQEFCQNYILGLDFKTNLGLDIPDVLNAGIERKFQINSKLDLKKYKNQYYYNLYGYHKNYYANLGNINDLTLYQNHLSQTYKGYLNLLFRNAITPQTFFDKFGTHIIVSSIYGGRLEFVYSSCNNQVEINAELETKVKNEITAKLNSSMVAGGNYQFHFGASIGYSQLSFVENYSVNSLGGNSFSLSNMDTFSSNYQNWINSLTISNASLIDIAPNGIIPLWELLPSHYANKKAEFKEMCQNYIKTNTSALHIPTFDPELGDSYTNEFCVIRSDEKRITDQGVFVNPYDEVDLNFLTTYGFQALKDLGYKTINIVLEMQMREENKGYQLVALNAVLSSGEGEKWIFDREIELGGSNKQTEYVTQQFSKNNISLESLESGILRIRYSARGVGSDDWYCKDVKIKVTYYK